MGRIFSGFIVFSALMMGFVAGSGVVGWILTAGGYGKVGAVGPAVAAAPQVGAIPAAQSAPRPAPVVNVQPEVKVVSTEMKFSPSSLHAKVGQPLKVVLENKGVIEHDIAVPTLKADKSADALKVLAKPSQSATLEFTPAARGTYEYYCTIPGHREAGMRGNLGVVD